MRRLLLLAPLLFVVAQCGFSDPPPRVELPPLEVHVPCTDRDPLRRPLFGDLHVHTTYSFDAHIFDVRNRPDDAYRFARGEALTLPPLDKDGRGTRAVKLDRPLDFAAVTDHSEFLGEVEECTVPSSPVFDSDTCVAYRGEPYAATARMAFPLTLDHPHRPTDVCGDDEKGCAAASSSVWKRIQSAADGAYDRSASCRFTSFVGYEYTGVTGAATQHRNVIFKNERVPEPTTYFEQPTADGLWSELDRTCRSAGTGCDVLAIPHNSNESNGRMFHVETGAGIDDERKSAALRRAFEPLAEVYQHKGDSECRNGVASVGEPDEACDWEKRGRKTVTDCGDGIGGGGVADSGCFSRRDFLRGALLEGLRQKARLGVNPYQFGMIASTDTHNGTPGFVDERSFAGHRGTDDDTPEKQLGPGVLTPGGIAFSPGGLVGVWAEENTRDAIFAALARREAWGTSGPRMVVRFFGGDGLASPALCTDPQLVAKGYATGVPMGGTLPKRTQPPSFVVAAEADPGPSSQPGTPLQRIQIVKGWFSGDQTHEKIYDVAGTATEGTVDVGTCARSGADTRSLCASWTDPDFDPSALAFYYVRVLEQPTCRWSTWLCNSLPPSGRPASCTDPAVPKTVQERAWTSPIWYEP